MELTSWSMRLISSSRACRSPDWARRTRPSSSLLDATAKAAYKARLEELQAELEEAERFNDPARAAKARAERDFLVGELARAVGLGGRDRRAAAHAERARLNATRAIRAAVANLARVNPALGRHLAVTIRTGRYCAYLPDPRAPIGWEGAVVHSASCQLVGPIRVCAPYAQTLGWTDAWTSQASAYAVLAQSSADVAAAVNFAREHRVRLVVKGGGHSYVGGSNAPDSLLIWTRPNMRAVELHDRFVPRGAAGLVEPETAVSVGAGAIWMDVYAEVTTTAGRYVQGGACTPVGVPGLVQGGGFGSFSKGFGTAAA